MPTETALNQLVKGAPPPSLNTPTPAPLPPLSPSSSTQKYTPPDLSLLPSSPPAIYLNLLILESSLRSQYLHLLSRRRLNSFFCFLLSLWNIGFTYVLFLRPREDGRVGGSVYWMVEAFYKMAFMGGVVTALLIWATGQWERGVRWPRKWLGTTNRGLRGFNLRVVVVKRRWWREFVGHFAFLLPLTTLFSDEAGGFADWHMVENEVTGQVVEEDLTKGGDHILLLLLPKSFSPEFRENWEEYRSEYWERENERRSELRRKVKIRYRQKAREAGGWKWYTGLWRMMPHHHHRRPHDLEKHPAGHHHTQSHSQHLKDPAKANRRRSLLRSDSAHSRQSSRSSTPVAANFELDGTNEKPLSERVRRGSSVSSTASVRRKKRESALGLSMTSSDLGNEKRKHARPTTPEGELKSKRQEEVSGGVA